MSVSVYITFSCFLSPAERAETFLGLWEAGLGGGG